MRRMPLTRRAFLKYSGPTLAGLSTLSHTSCSRTPATPPTASDKRSWEERLTRLDSRIRQTMNDLHVPGVSIALIRAARIAWTKGFGVRDQSTGAPVDEDTLFSAQSMSKPVFAYRVMKLVEQRVIDLDTPLTRYTTDVFVKNDPRLNEITARRVLSHTTGLPNWRSKEEPLRINFAPGSKWSYSGEGYHYLQSVVTHLTGHTDTTQCRTFETDYRVCATDFGEYMEANVLKPFAMTRSGYVYTAAMGQNMASRHDKAGALMPQKTGTAVDVARYGAAGSLMTTATDYAKFLLEVMQPKPADDYRLTAATRAEMLTPQIKVEPSPVKISWALGWQIWHMDEGDIVAHGGDDDGWHCQSMCSPERKTGFVVLTNGEGGGGMIFNELLKPLVSDFIFT
jgi:CubicO group peptidase (beta-lactamase class C family)